MTFKHTESPQRAAVDDLI